MGKTTTQKGADVVKDGIRHKDVYATAVGDITKAYFPLVPKKERIHRRVGLASFRWQPASVMLSERRCCAWQVFVPFETLDVWEIDAEIRFG